MMQLLKTQCTVTLVQLGHTVQEERRKLPQLVSVIALLHLLGLVKLIVVQVESIV